MTDGGRKRQNTTRANSTATAITTGTATNPSPPLAATTTSQSSAPSTRRSRRKSTINELRKEVGYLARERNRSRKECAHLKQQLAEQARQHDESVNNLNSKLSTTSDECKQLSALAQDRRREGNHALMPRLLQWPVNARTTGWRQMPRWQRQSPASPQGGLGRESLFTILAA